MNKLLTQAQNYWEVIKTLLIIVFIGFMVLFVSFGITWIDSHKESFSNSQLYKKEVEYQKRKFRLIKEREAIKMYREYRFASPDHKIIISNMVAISFCEIDESELPSPFNEFVYKCKHK